ncbi:MAG: hypothetical protein ACYSUN_05460, partial [Planctomycetota bacterium]
MPVPLVELDLPTPGSEPFPEVARSLLLESERRMEAFFERRGGRPVPGFVPGDFERIGRALRALVRARLAAGDFFCEWGSG